MKTLQKATSIGLALTVASAVFCAEASAGQWVKTNNTECDIVCDKKGSAVVNSGTMLPSGQPYMVCAAEVKGSGLRGGYQVRPKWSNACWVAYGGKEMAITPYQCLCQ
jgi:hypothetical protein